MAKNNCNFLMILVFLKISSKLKLDVDVIVNPKCHHQYKQLFLRSGHRETHRMFSM